MLTLDDLRVIAKQAVENPYPHDGLASFMRETSVTDPYYAFLYGLSKIINPDYALETGVELGRGLYSIAAGCPSCDCVGVELHGRVPDTWIKYVGQFNNARIVSGTNTLDWLLCPSNRRRPIDIAFLDSDHHFETIMTEWCLVRPMMRPGSIVIFDDSEHDGPSKILKEIALPHILFDGSDGVKLHGDNGFSAVLIPKE